MPKITLKIKPRFDFILIGIYSQTTIYKLCWLINKELNYDFKRIEDLKIQIKKTTIDCPLYFYEYEKDYTQFYIFPNSVFNEFVILEMKDLNYIFLIKGVFSEENKKKLVQQLKKVSQIILAVEIKAESLNTATKNNLLLAMEGQ